MNNQGNLIIFDRRSYMIKNTAITYSNYKNITLAVFSDIHYCKNYPRKRLDAIYRNIQEYSPNYICIVGDLLDQGDVLQDESCKEEFIGWLQQLSKIAPILIAIGNHDVTLHKNGRCQYYYPKELLEIGKYSNIYILDNSCIILDSICFLGYTPPYSYYENHEKVDIYQSDIDTQLGSIFSKNCDTSCDTILLCHTPLYVIHPKVRQTSVLCAVRLVLSGHMHNGLIPFSCRGNYGLIEPFKKLFPKYARGSFQLDHIHYLISGGVITFSNLSPKWLHPLNAWYPIHIEYVKF